jgi:hypothetical protein
MHFLHNGMHIITPCTSGISWAANTERNGGSSPRDYYIPFFSLSLMPFWFISRPIEFISTLCTSLTHIFVKLDSAIFRFPSRYSKYLSTNKCHFLFTFSNAIYHFWVLHTYLYYSHFIIIFFSLFIVLPSYLSHFLFLIYLFTFFF